MSSVTVTTMNCDGQTAEYEVYTLCLVYNPVVRKLVTRLLAQVVEYQFTHAHYNDTVRIVYSFKLSIFAGDHILSKSFCTESG